MTDQLVVTWVILLHAALPTKDKYSLIFPFSFTHIKYQIITVQFWHPKN